ncbi:MAG: chemotaxis protein CheW [Acidobacteria bacterium]|nr:chemotaxis protein CheW [Acidobacteriota bacterium]
MTKRKASSTIQALLRLASLPGKLNAADDEPHTADQLSVLMLDIGEEVFAVSVETIEGVVDCPKLAPLPFPPEGIIGVASVRGRMTLVMNLSASNSSSQSVNRQRLVLLKGESQMGLLADRIEDVVTLARDAVESSGKRLGNKEPQPRWPVSGLFKNKERRIPILDCERLLET